MLRHLLIKVDMMVMDINNTRRDISDNRSMMMGLAILWIMLFHQHWIQSVCPLLSGVCSCGLWGVEVFLFLSGMGISHSLDRNTTKLYFKNRFLRIIPIVVVVETLSFVIDRFGWDILPDSIVIFIGGIHIWYVKAIIVYYLLAPIINKYIEKNALLLFIGSVILYLSSLFVDFGILMPERIIARIPVFVMGMAFAKCKIRINNTCLFFSFVIFAIAIWLNVNGKLYGMDDFSLFPIAILFGVPALIYTFIYLSKGIKCLHLDAPFMWLGKRSLELYLWNESMYIILDYYNISPLLKFVIALSLTFIFAELSHWIAQPLVNFCKGYILVKS